MIDSAVTRFGLWAEARVHETHQVGQAYLPRWTPAQIFDAPTDTGSVSALAAAGDAALDWLDEMGGSF